MTTEPIYLSPRQPNYFLILLYALLFIAIFLFCFKGCKKDTIIINDNKLAKDTIYKLKIKIDSIDIERIKYVSKWRVLRDTINITDTIQVIAALNKCDTIILTDSIEINFLQMVNRKLFRVVKSDSLVIDSLTRSKKKYWRGFKHGIIIGGGASTIIYGSVIGR